MRPIKFRAWDKRNELMFYNIENGMQFIDGSCYSFHDYLDEPGRWEVMQLTGLTDKNGKDVYEGDLVKYGTYKGEVKWESQTSVHYGHGDSTHTYYVGFSVGDYGNEFDPNELEVIGNIFESKESN